MSREKEWAMGNGHPHHYTTSPHEQMSNTDQTVRQWTNWAARDTAADGWSWRMWTSLRSSSGSPPRCNHAGGPDYWLFLPLGITPTRGTARLHRTLDYFTALQRWHRFYFIFNKSEFAWKTFQIHVTPSSCDPDVSKKDLQSPTMTTHVINYK